MLLPHSHAWTRTQKWLLVAGAALVLLAIGTAGVAYERYYRGPGEEILYGTWEAVDFLDGDTIYFHFRVDQTFTAGGLFEGEFSRFADGTWYAGGPNVYIRFSADDLRAPTRVIVFHIVDVQPNALRVRLFRDGLVYTFRRSTLKVAFASNKSLEPTTDRREYFRMMTSTAHSEGSRGGVSGGSAQAR